MLALDNLASPTFTRLYLHRITSVVMSELASCHKEFQYPVMKVLRYKQLDTTCFGKSRDACIVTMLNRIRRRVKWASGLAQGCPARPRFALEVIGSVNVDNVSLHHVKRHAM